MWKDNGYYGSWNEKYLNQPQCGQKFRIIISHCNSQGLRNCKFAFKKKQFWGTSLQKACLWQRQVAVAEKWLFWGGGGMQLETRFGKKGESVCTSLFESKRLEMKLAMAYIHTYVLYLRYHKK